MTPHKEVLCCYEGCSGIICMTSAQEEKFRRTHEDFRCPYGHIQGFYGPNEQEKKIKRLEEQLAFERQKNQWKQETIDELRAELRSRSARIAAKTRQLRSRHLRSVA